MKEVTHIVSMSPPEPRSYSATELNAWCGISGDELQTFEEERLVAPKEGTYSQRDADQIYSIRMLAMLYHLDPRSLQPLYELLAEHVMRLPIKDTDLYLYDFETGPDDPRTSRDIMALILKKVFRRIHEIRRASSRR